MKKIMNHEEGELATMAKIDELLKPFRKDALETMVNQELTRDSIWNKIKDEKEQAILAGPRQSL